MQWHYGLCLLFKKYTYGVWYLRCFIWTNGSQITLFRVDCQKDLFYLLFEKRACILVMRLCMCRFVLRSGSLDIIGLHRESALTPIVHADALIDNVVLQINVFVLAPCYSRKKQY